MKKALIAGAASTVLAAMPIVGVFADVTTQTDTLEITIPEVCSFGYTDANSGIDVDTVDHDAGEGNNDGNYIGGWTLKGATTADPADPANDTLSVTMATGTVSDSIGTTTLGVYCNDEDGYTITASGAGNLSGTGLTHNIPVSSSFSDSSTGWSYKVVAGDGTNQRGTVSGYHGEWANATAIETAGSERSAANSQIASSSQTTHNDGDFFTITYGAGIGYDLGAGTYSGSITYTLADIDL